MNPEVARRFPLIARPRPACTPLVQRVADLEHRAALAQEHHNAAAATAVFNLAALLASDCGLPDLARTWCHRLAAITLAHSTEPRHALEPIVNLARLHIRAGDGPTAWTLLETLYQAITTRTDTMIDGIMIPAAHLTETPTSHTNARTWLWSVLLGTGAHALATASRWDEASQRLAQHNGVGERMLDGRQVTVIAHAVAGRHKQAHTLLCATQPGETWENAVTASLHLHVPGRDPAEATTIALTTYHSLGPIEPTLFRTRLGLILVDALHANHPERDRFITDLVALAAEDGYAARDFLEHPECADATNNQQRAELADLLSRCGLGQGALPAAVLAAIEQALNVAEATITQSTCDPAQSATATTANSGGRRS
ncbi:hypothetical protein QEZ54_08890 [Catellatospora sp. KI3]|uniref:hypothetical protein n=1 Tax=Catellatospora sp. KI3 TaxID=3041620 RepID=UPI002482612E|nr:hypothetical protein [Catellatospora sp. KI3]MDI1461078.1 hypothetical protein [Catellatospora sp. KI3]